MYKPVPQVLLHDDDDSENEVDTSIYFDQRFQDSDGKHILYYFNQFSFCLKNIFAVIAVWKFRTSWKSRRRVTQVARKCKTVSLTGQKSRSDLLYFQLCWFCFAFPVGSALWLLYV